MVVYKMPDFSASTFNWSQSILSGLGREEGWESYEKDKKYFQEWQRCES